MDSGRNLHCLWNMFNLRNISRMLNLDLLSSIEPRDNRMGMDRLRLARSPDKNQELGDDNDILWSSGQESLESVSLDSQSPIWTSGNGHGGMELEINSLVTNSKYENDSSSNFIEWMMNGTTTATNASSFDPTDLPVDLRIMSDNSRTCVIVYLILFLIASTGNLTVFISFYKVYRKHGSRISLLILHLSIADLIVTFCLIPIEIAWRITIQWYGGNILCKSCQFLRAFGLYLSSMVLICVSFDRFFAILFPMKMMSGMGKRRVKLMLAMAWIASGVFSAPQAVLFSVETHPKFPSFHQCVTSSFLSRPEDVKLYSIFSVSAMYFVPLGVIIMTYTAILIRMIHRSRQQTLGNQLDKDGIEEGLNQTVSSPSVRSAHGHSTRRSILMAGRERAKGGKSCSIRLLEVPQGGGIESSELSNSTSPEHGIGQELELDDVEEEVNVKLKSSWMSRRNTNSQNHGKPTLVLRMSENATAKVVRAKSRTMKLTIVILLVFVLCWTPYAVITLWYMFDWDTATKVNPLLQDALFLMAVANSCVNPLIYGSFTKNCCGITAKRLNRSQSALGNRQTKPAPLHRVSTKKN